jgi:hypothetical protein
MVGPFRTKMLAAQRGIDPITGRQITDPVLDHCHKTGHVRAVLQRWTNGVFGRLENWASRLGGEMDPVVFLRASADYIETHRTTPSGVLYPTHKTEAEKRDARNAKARKDRAAARKTAQPQ